MARKTNHVDVRHTRDDQWYFVDVYRNGERGPVSERYTRRYNATKAAARDNPGVEVHVYNRHGALVRILEPAA